MVDPVCEGWICKVTDWDSLKFGIFNEVSFSFLIFTLVFLLLVELVVAEGRDVGAGGDSGDLGTQVVRLVTGKGGIGANLLGEITSEQLSNFSGTCDLDRGDIRQTDPFIARLQTYFYFEPKLR